MKKIDKIFLKTNTLSLDMYLEKVLYDCKYIMGPEVKELEIKLQEYTKNIFVLYENCCCFGP